MAEAFQISCVVQSLTNWGHRHITAIGTAAKPGAPERWEIAAVLGRLSAGDVFYMVDTSGDPVFVRPHRCWCGIQTIRTKGEDQPEDVLDAVLGCTWASQHAVPDGLPPFKVVEYVVTKTPRSPRSEPAGSSMGTQ